MESPLSRSGNGCLPENPDKGLRQSDSCVSSAFFTCLCFEKERAHCHQGLVAAWFHETREITVPELGSESVTQRYSSGASADLF
jgi:hypothetical protein